MRIGPYVRRLPAGARMVTNKEPGYAYSDPDVYQEEGFVETKKGNIAHYEFIYNRKTRDAQITTIRVSDSFKGKGIGRHVVKEMERRMKKLGSKRIFLGSIWEAKPFWKRMGYRTIDKWRDKLDTEHAHSAITYMEKQI